ncbi:MAG: putative type secretion system protein [Planctomycetota bacterium]
MNISMNTSMRSTTNSTMRSTRGHARRGSVIVLVIWAVAIAAVIVGAAQVMGFRAATMGREAIAKVEARWAARAGIEETLAVLEYHTEEPDPTDARQLFKDLELVADGELASGSWEIRHVEDGVEIRGPQDEHAKINVNNATKATLLELSGMSLDVADAIVDWRDADDNAGMMGAEYDYYVNRDLGYEPRNGPFRSIAELELVAGAYPSSVRGEDANLNGRLDPNENDGALSEPKDDADGLLDAGWSGALTARTTGSLLSSSGAERLNLKQATAEEMQERLGVTAQQAASLATFAKRSDAKLEMLLTQDLNTLATSGAQSGRGTTRGTGSTGGQSGGAQSGRSSSGLRGNQSAGSQNRIQSLDQQQLRKVFQEATLDDGTTPIIGKVNLNTVSPAILRAMLPDDPISADAIIAQRSASSSGLLSISDLRDSSRITPQAIAALAPMADTQSYVFTVTSRGRSATTGLEVEITAVLDRSTLPARILEYREQ